MVKKIQLYTYCQQGMENYSKTPVETYWYAAAKRHSCASWHDGARGGFCRKTEWMRLLSLSKRGDFGIPAQGLCPQCRVLRPVLRRLVPRRPVLCRQPEGVWLGLAYRGAAPHYAALVWGYRGVASSRLLASPFSEASFPVNVGNLRFIDQREIIP